jgi:hypothetical protein
MFITHVYYIEQFTIFIAIIFLFTIGGVKYEQPQDAEDSDDDVSIIYMKVSYTFILFIFIKCTYSIYI